MKKSAFISIGTTMFSYMSVAICGYAAFGDDAPGILLTGFSTPCWLVEFPHTCIVLHLSGAYQVYTHSRRYMAASKFITLLVFIAALIGGVAGIIEALKSSFSRLFLEIHPQLDFSGSLTAGFGSTSVLRLAPVKELQTGYFPSFLVGGTFGGTQTCWERGSSKQGASQAHFRLLSATSVK